MAILSNMTHGYEIKRESNYFAAFSYQSLFNCHGYGNTVKYNLQVKISYWKLPHNCQYSY